MNKFQARGLLALLSLVILGGLKANSQTVSSFPDLCREVHLRFIDPDPYYITSYISTGEKEGPRVRLGDGTVYKLAIPKKLSPAGIVGQRNLRQVAFFAYSARLPLSLCVESGVNGQPATIHMIQIHRQNYPSID